MVQSVYPVGNPLEGGRVDGKTSEEGPSAARMRGHDGITQTCSAWVREGVRKLVLEPESGERETQGALASSSSD